MQVRAACGATRAIHMPLGAVWPWPLYRHTMQVVVPAMAKVRGPRLAGETTVVLWRTSDSGSERSGRDARGVADDELAVSSNDGREGDRGAVGEAVVDLGWAHAGKRESGIGSRNRAGGERSGEEEQARGCALGTVILAGERRPRSGASSSSSSSSSSSRASSNSTHPRHRLAQAFWLNCNMRICRPGVAAAPDDGHQRGGGGGGT